MVQIEGNNAKADDAIMLDKDGFVSETNATNIVCLELRLICYKSNAYLMQNHLLEQCSFSH
jgi:hypothetical protein